MALKEINPLIDKLSKQLFQPEGRRLAGLLKDIDRQNREIKSATLNGFIYRGQVYIPEGTTVVAGKQAGNYPTLAFQLLPSMQAYMQDKQEIETDQKLTEQMLYKLLYQANDYQEIRDALPDFLVNLVPDLQRIPRKLPEAFLLQNDFRAYDQYWRFRSKLEFYVTTRMFY